MKKIMGVMLAFAAFLAPCSARAFAFRESSVYVESRKFSPADIYLFIERPQISRLKVFYLSGNVGHISPKSLEIRDGTGCSNAISGLFCDAIREPLDIEATLSDRMFFSAGMGFNTRTIFRFDAEWFRLRDSMKMSGSWMNFVNSMHVSLDMDSKVDVEGATVNMYIDLVPDRSQPGWLAVPYVMGGIGRSSVKLDDVSIQRSDGVDFFIEGRRQNTTTIVLGGGFSIGVNNYIVVDAGYRFYDFGKVNPANRIILTGSGDAPVDIEMKMKAHVARLGLRLQI